MSADENMSLVRRGIEECLNKGNLAVADEIFTPDFVFHTPARPEPFRGPQGFKEYVGMIRSAFPDAHFEIEDIFADEGRVAARWMASVTHEGDFFGIPPTGNAATFTGVHVYRIVDGQIAEEWQELSALRLMQDLRILPPVDKLPRPLLKALVRLQGLGKGKRARNAPQAG